jgi:glycine/serine hydroxymethyltransferase
MRYLTAEQHDIYSKWNNELAAQKVSLSLLSGLHRSIILFMSIGGLEDNILVVPPAGGGSKAAQGVLPRLGYTVVDMEIDESNNCVDKDKTLAKLTDTDVDFVFVSPSNTMKYTDFSWLKALKSDTILVFDATPYMSGILSGDLMSPLDMGFDIVIASLHSAEENTQNSLCCISEKAARGNICQRMLSSNDGYVHSITTEEAFEKLRHTYLP